MKKFERLFVLGLPASGKSELLDYIRKSPDKERLDRFHIGKMLEMDDFPMLWEKFEEDNLWEKITGKRLHSTRDAHAYMNSDELFDFVLGKLDANITKKYLNNEEFYKESTLLIEFARGGAKPYGPSFKWISPEVFASSAIFYVQVRPEESARRNEARYQEKLKHSILAHKTPDAPMERFYRGDDWTKITDGKPAGFLELNDVKVPFVTMNNEPELPPGKEIAQRYEAAFNKLFELYAKS